MKKKSKPKKRQTVQVPDGEGWSRTVEVPRDETPRRSRFDGDIKVFSAHELVAELRQIEIDYECGPGPTAREMLTARDKNIRDELARRNNLLKFALEREEATRGKGRITLPDVKVETQLSTVEVVMRLEKWLEATRTNMLDGARLRDVSELINLMLEECEGWVEIIEER